MQFPVNGQKKKKWQSGAWQMHHDNIQVHSQFLARHRVPQMPQPLYSADMAP